MNKSTRKTPGAKSPNADAAKGPDAPLKINGVPLVEALASRSVLMQILAFLNASEDGEVFDNAALAAALGIAVNSLTSNVRARYKQQLCNYHITVGHIVYWARPENIERFMKAVTAATQEAQ